MLDTKGNDQGRKGNSCAVTIAECCITKPTNFTCNQHKNGNTITNWQYSMACRSAVAAEGAVGSNRQSVHPAIKAVSFLYICTASTNLHMWITCSCFLRRSLLFHAVLLIVSCMASLLIINPMKSLLNWACTQVNSISLLRFFVKMQPNEYVLKQHWFFKNGQWIQTWNGRQCKRVACVPLLLIVNVFAHTCALTACCW